MGRIDTSTDEQVGGVEFHEADGAPPPMEDDLYEPPPHYHHPSTNQRSTPPPQPFPPPQHDPPPPPPPPFPPPQDPMHPAAAHVHHFPPPQDPMHPSAAAHVHHFPPPQDPMHPAAHHFPPPQDPMNPAAAAAAHHFPPPPDKPPMGQPFTPPPQQQHFPSNFTNANPYIHHQQQPQNFQQGIPMGLQHTQPWNTHLFDCMKNPQNAIITLFFPCVTFGQIAEILDSGSTSCGTSGMLYSLIACCIAMPCIMSCTYRSKLRSKFGLIESPAPDWAIHCFCECCALCQEYRELEERGFDPSIGWMGNVAKQQQKQQQFGMTPPMQQRMF